MVPVGKVEEVIYFLVGAIGVVEWVVVVVVGVGGNGAPMIGSLWMGEDGGRGRGVGVDVLITEEMLLTGVEVEVTVAALKKFVHGIIVVVAAEAEVGVGAGVGIVVEVVVGLVVGVAVTAVAEAEVAVAAAAVVAVVEVTVGAVVAAPAMIDAIGQIDKFLIKMTVGDEKQKLLNQECPPCLPAIRRIHFRVQNTQSSYQLLGVLSLLIQILQ